jgi:hypothetical protein
MSGKLIVVSKKHTRRLLSSPDVYRLHCQSEPEEKSEKIGIIGTITRKQLDEFENYSFILTLTLGQKIYPCS